MALKPCRECNKKVSTEAGSCPSCGAPDPTRVLPLKKGENIYEDIWLYAKPAYDTVLATFNYVTAQLDEDNAFRIFSITGYFKRGIFEASCEHHNLDKSDFKKAALYCFRRIWDDEGYKAISNEKKDSMALDTYQRMEDGLRLDDSVGKMCSNIINTAKKSFKESGAGCFADASKLWKDPNIQFTETPITRNVKNFFSKLF